MMGSIVGGIQQSQELKSQENVALYNAKVDEQNAKSIEAAGILKSQQQAEEADRTQSTIEAGIGISGASSDAGSPLLIQAKQASQSELENLMIGYDTQTGAQQQRIQGVLDTTQAKYLKQQAKNRLVGGFLNAAAYSAPGFQRMMSSSSQTQLSGFNTGMFNSGSYNQSPSGFGGFGGTPTYQGTYYA
jgi:hypothetical protein